MPDPTRRSVPIATLAHDRAPDRAPDPARDQPPHTDRLLLRRLRPDDQTALAAVFADLQARQFYPQMGDPAAVTRWIDWNLKNYQAFGFGLWALETRHDGQLIGDAGITWQRVGSGRLLEIGWHLHADARGRGYATEAGQACLRWAWQVLQAELVGSIVDPRNAPSMAVAARVHAARRQFVTAKGPMWLYHSAAPGALADEQPVDPCV